MKNFRFLLLAGVAGAALPAAPNDANAMAYVLTQLNLSGLTLNVDPNSHPFGVQGTTNQPGFEFTLTNTASLNSSAKVETAPVVSKSFFNSGFDKTGCTGTGATCVDPKEAVKGGIATSAATQNNFDPRVMDATSSFARSDSILVSTSINLDTGGLGGRLLGVSEGRSAGGPSSGKVDASTGVNNSQLWGFQSAFGTVPANQSTARIKFFIDALSTATFSLPGEASDPGSIATAAIDLTFQFAKTDCLDGSNKPAGSPATLATFCGAHGGVNSNAASKEFKVSLGTNGKATTVKSEDDIETGVFGSVNVSELVAGNGEVFGAASGSGRQLQLDFAGIKNGMYRFNIFATTSVQAFTTAVPEPATLALLGVGLLGIGGIVRRRRQRQ